MEQPSPQPIQEKYEQVRGVISQGRERGYLLYALGRKATSHKSPYQALGTEGATALVHHVYSFYIDIGGHRFFNRHQLSDYLLFAVDTSQEIKPPREENKSDTR